jgi:hypothetical protein
MSVGPVAVCSEKSGQNQYRCRHLAPPSWVSRSCGHRRFVVTTMHESISVGALAPLRFRTAGRLFDVSRVAMVRLERIPMQRTSVPGQGTTRSVSLNRLYYTILRLNLRACKKMGLNHGSYALRRVVRPSAARPRGMHGSGPWAPRVRSTTPRRLVWSVGVTGSVGSRCCQRGHVAGGRHSATIEPFSAKMGCIGPIFPGVMPVFAELRLANRGCSRFYFNASLMRTGQNPHFTDSTQGGHHGKDRC